jgi:hypothetical protein
LNHFEIRLFNLDIFFKKKNQSKRLKWHIYSIQKLDNNHGGRRGTNLGIPTAGFFCGRNNPEVGRVEENVRQRVQLFVFIDLLLFFIGHLFPTSGPCKAGCQGN